MGGPAGYELPDDVRACNAHHPPAPPSHARGLELARGQQSEARLPRISTSGGPWAENGEAVAINPSLSNHCWLADTPPKGPPPPCPVGGWWLGVGCKVTGRGWHQRRRPPTQATPEFLARDATNRLLLCNYVLTGRVWCMHRVCGNWRVP